MSDTFNKALQNMTVEFAGGGAVRHMADLGYNVDRIRESLDYPLSRDRIRDMLWKYYVDAGRILPEEPSGDQPHTKVTYIKETGAYGKTSFRRVEKPVTDGSAVPAGRERSTDQKAPVSYVPCDFGIQRARDEAAFLEHLSVLDPADRDYVLDLPWPRARVWHVADERMRRIAQTLGAGVIG